MKLDDIRRLLRPLSVRISNLVTRAVVKRADDSKQVQELQVEYLGDVVRDEVERFQNYGFTSVPKAGAEAVVVGLSDKQIALGVEDRRWRVKDLGDGEVCVYDHTGSTFIFKANGDAELAPSSGVVKITGSLQLTGNITADGTITGGDVVGGGKDLKTHSHSFTDVTPGGSVVSETLGPS